MSVTPTTGDSPVWREGRFRYGWLFAGVWLFYLGETLSALLHRPQDWQRVVGLVALPAFAVAYLLAVAQRRRYRSMPQQPDRSGWVPVSGLVALAALLVPGAGQHAFAALVYIAALAMMSLPLRPALVFNAVLFLLAEALPALVPGWRDTGNGLGVLLATIAVWGIRLAFERNTRLVAAQAEVGRLAVQDERARIAGDLHDILGHSLTVVTVKAELAQRLLDVDPERARTELRDLEALSRDALRDVRATALGVRGVSLPGEIAAARQALAAAGVTAVLPTVADEVPTRWRELFAWTVREAVTNVVRHSGASCCEVRLTPSSVEVLDDGVGPVGPSPGSSSADGTGIAGLRGRAESLHGRLLAGGRPDGPGFRLRVEVPA